jgi:hypothetical protein
MQKKREGVRGSDKLSVYKINRCVMFFWCQPFLRHNLQMSTAKFAGEVAMGT